MKEKVFTVVSQVMNVPVESVNEESSPDSIAEWDSLHHMNLVLALEEEFKVQFTDEQAVNMLNVKLILLTLEELGVNS
ncbi:MAG: acyl carrier protein [Candidatus Omnitrophica bacterium]|nr:acyl carrier protein [Candidatus Omnitrophota bacterium]